MLSSLTYTTGRVRNSGANLIYDASRPTSIVGTTQISSWASIGTTKDIDLIERFTQPPNLSYNGTDTVSEPTLNGFYNNSGSQPWGPYNTFTSYMVATVNDRSLSSTNQSISHNGLSVYMDMNDNLGIDSTESNIPYSDIENIPSIIVARFDATNNRLRVYNTLVDKFFDDNVSTFVGASVPEVAYSAANGIGSEVYEIGYFDTALDNDRIETLVTFLTQKWDIDLTDTLSGSLLVHFDASNLSTLTKTVNEVDEIRCVTGTTAHTMNRYYSTGSVTHGVDTRNGLDLLTFNGTDFLLSTEAASTALNTAPYDVTVYVCANETSTISTSEASFVTFHNYLANSNWFHVLQTHIGTEGSSIRSYGSGLFKNIVMEHPTVDSAYLVSGGFHIFAYRIGVSTSDHRFVYKTLSEVKIVTSSATITSAAFHGLAMATRDPTNINIFHGQVGEVRLYDKGHTDAQMDTMIAILSDKWGI